LFTVVVTDSTVPSTQASQSFSVIVLQPSTPTFSSPSISDGTFQCMIGGSVGPNYSIYATTNLLSSWQLLLVTNPVATPFLFADPNLPAFQQRFYRIQLGP
jgi:hypothetical protein